MSKLNILDLHRIANIKIEKKESVYNKVVENSHKVIKRAAENGRKNCAYDVPEHLIGYPVYDLNACLSFVINALKKDGFLTKYYFPKVIYISWDYEELSNQQNLFVSNGLRSDTSSNGLRSMSTINSKNNGKLSINL